MAASKKTEAKATEATKEEVTKISLMDKIKNSRPAKYLKVHGKDLLIGFGIGSGTAAAGYGTYKLVKNHKAKQLDIYDLPSTEDDPYLSDVTSDSGSAAPTEE
jgi:hypothetical protein